MSSSQTPTSEVPFGYTFNESDRNVGMYSNQPSGTELLDHDERDLLNNFFQNPDSIDSSYLFSQDLQGQNGNMFNDTPFGWSYVPQADYSSNTTPLPELKPIAAEDGSRHNAGTYSVAGQHHEDDVYNAAKLLHDNRAAHQSNRNGRTDAPFQPAQSTGPQVSGAPVYNYPPVPSYSAQPFDFNSSNNNNNGYYEQNIPHRPSPSRGTNGSSRVVNNISSDVRTGPLRFGSDETFRSHYAGKMNEAPDTQLKEIVSQHFSPYDNPGEPNVKPLKSQNPQPRSPEKPGYDQSRNGRASHSDDGDESSEDDSTRMSKRRKRVKDEDEDFEEPGRSRRRQSPTSPHKRRKSSPSAAKNARENLSEEQKRSNHIQSEQRRRNLIKQGFEDLGVLVPELRSGGMSKSNVLVEVAKFMRSLKQGNDELRKRSGMPPNPG